MTLVYESSFDHYHTKLSWYFPTEKGGLSLIELTLSNTSHRVLLTLPHS
jgi:hypothetical protein